MLSSTGHWRVDRQTGWQGVKDWSRRREEWYFHEKVQGKNHRERAKVLASLTWRGPVIRFQRDSCSPGTTGASQGRVRGEEEGGGAGKREGRKGREPALTAL
jgi:hypothetical protein